MELNLAKNNNVSNSKMLLYRQCMVKVAISLFICLLGCLFGQYFVSEAMSLWVGLISVLILLFAFIVKGIKCGDKKVVSFNIKYVYLFTFMEGLMLSSLIKYYVQDLGIGVVIITLVGTIVWSLFLGYRGYTANTDRSSFNSLGVTLFFGLLCCIVMGIITLFIYNDIMLLCVSVLSFVIFSCYISWDIRKLRYAIEDGIVTKVDDLSIYVLNIYLDIINIFLDLLRILSILDD